MTYVRYESAGHDLPARLRQIPDAPRSLYWSGMSPNSYQDIPCIGIVGSRKVSPYGRQITLKFAEELARQGIVIVSGLALGVDTLAHTGALSVGGKTIAVMPCSLDRVYPVTNTGLARRILQEQGTLVSEYDAGAPFIYKYNFVARNRLIAGLSDAILIPEAAVDSGSLHTAQFALEQGKEVMVVPGNITSPTSAGTNNLLKIGATPVTCVDDILRALKLDPGAVQPAPRGQTPQQQQVLQLLADGVHDGEALYAGSGLTITDFNQALTMLEINGQVRAGGANTWY